MSFAHGFYRFIIDLSHQNHAIYEHVTVRTPLHPQESMQALLLRIITFCHAYLPGLNLSAGMFENELPTAWRRSATSELDLWVMLGEPDRKLFDRLARQVPSHAKSCKYNIYFSKDEERLEFCKHLRTSRNNWVKLVDFFQIQTPSLEYLERETKSSSRWGVTVIDDNLWISTETVELELKITKLDIWSEYQASLELS